MSKFKKISKNALGMLVAKYRSVLMRMFLKGSATVAVSCILLSSSTALAAVEYTNSVTGEKTVYENFQTLYSSVSFNDNDIITIFNENDLPAIVPDFKGKSVVIKNAAAPKTSNVLALKSGISAEVFKSVSDNSIYLPYGEARYSNVEIFGKKGSDSGSAVFIQGGSTLHADSIILTDNESAIRGGAAYITGGASMRIAQDAAFSANTSLGDGGAVYLYNGTLLTVGGNAEFSGNTAIDGGGAYVSGGSSIDIKNNVTFSGNVSKGQGGAVYFDHDGSLSVGGNAEFSGNTALDGGAVFLANGGWIDLKKDAKFINNQSQGQGGAAYLKEGDTLSIGGNTEFTGNKSYVGGAAFVTNGGRIFLKNAAFNNNVAQSQGGALYVQEGANITVSDAANFSGNKAVDGGALFLRTGGWIRFNAGTAFSGNEATSRGGAVHITDGAWFTINGKTGFSNNKAAQGGALHLINGGWIEVSDNSTFSGNEAAGQGGAVFLEWGGRLAVNAKADFIGNKAASGGALFLSGGGNLNIKSEGAFSGNEAKEDGGAAYINSQGSELIVGGKVSFSDNKATNANSNGGAVAIVTGGKLDAKEAVFSGNSAGGSGGAAYILGQGSNLIINSTGSFTNNKATDGGALFLDDGGNINIKSDGIFNANEAKGEGGAAYISGYGSTLTVDGRAGFSNNKATASNSNGGAVVLSGEGKLNTKEAVFSGNSAGAGGGAAYILGQGSQFVINGAGSFTGNKATDGGAAALGGGGKLNIKSDAVFNANEAKRQGGAVYISGYGSELIVDGRAGFSNNKVTDAGLSGGAAALINGGKLEAREAVFSGNSSGGSGGAAFLSSGGLIQAGELSFSNNAAKGHGGAVYLNESTLNATKFTFTGNDAGGSGGAIYLNNRNNINLDKTVLSQNHAGEHGGAVYFNSATNNITAKEAAFSKNQADKSGGAVYLANNSVFSADESFFTENKAGSVGAAAAVYNMSKLIANDTVFTGNLAELDGGAIYLENSELKADYVYIYSNSAKNGGGGLYLSGQSTLEGEKANFADNTAQYGGALYINNNNYELNVNKTIDFIGNIASANGGGAYLDSGSKLNFAQKASFYDNSAQNSGGALFLSDNNTLSLTNAYFEANIAQGTGGAAYIGKNSTINLISEKNQTTTFTENKHLNSTPNSIYFGGDNAALHISGSGMLSMYDPLAGDSVDNVTVTKSDLGIWKLGGNNQFSSTNTNFTIAGGMLELYEETAINIEHGSFTLKEGTTLALLGENQINIAEGYISFENDTTLAFDLTKAQEVGKPNETVNLKTTGNFKQTGSVKPEIHIDILSLKGSGTAQEFKLIEAANINPEDKFTIDKEFTLRGEKIDVSNSRINQIEVLERDEADKYIISLKLQAQNGVVKWDETATTGTYNWNTSAEHWDTSDIYGTTASAKLFLHGDAVVFEKGGGEIVIYDGGVQIEQQNGSVGMSINSPSNYIFTGGAIEGGGALTKSGTGVTVLANVNNAYLGETIVKEGTLIGNVPIGTKMTVEANAIYIAGDGTPQTNAERTFISLNGSGTVDMQKQNLHVGSGDFSKGTLIFDGGKEGILTKYTKDEFIIGDVDVGRVDVVAGTLKLDTAKQLNVQGEFGSASDGILDVYDGATLSVAVDNSKTPVTAKGVNFHPNAVLEVRGLSYDGNLYDSDSAAFAVYSMDIIESTTQISEIHHYHLVDDSPYAGAVTDRYLTAQIGLSDDRLRVIGAIGLAWNDGHQKDNTTDYDKAHGTFKIEGNHAFSINSTLADRSGETFNSGWDGRTLLKTGTGTLELTAANTYSGGTVIEEGILRAKNAQALGTGTVTNKAALEFDLNSGDTFSPNINGSNDSILTKMGSGTLTLAGNIYAGHTKVEGGHLILAGNAAELGIVSQSGGRISIGNGVNSTDVHMKSFSFLPQDTSLRALAANVDFSIEKNAQLTLAENSNFNSLLNNGTLNLSSTNNAIRKEINISDYAGNGVINLQGSATAKEKWVDFLSFDNFSPDSSNTKIHFQFNPGSSLHYLAEGSRQNFTFAEIENHSANDAFRADVSNIGVGAYEVSVESVDNGKNGRLYYLNSNYNESLSEVYPEDSATVLEQAAALNDPILYRGVASAIKAAADGDTGIYVIGEKFDLKNNIGSFNEIKGNRFLAAMAWRKNKTAYGILGQKFDGSYTGSHIATLSNGAKDIVHSGANLEYTDVGFFLEGRPQGFSSDGTGVYYNIIVKRGRSNHDFYDDHSADFYSKRTSFDVSLGVGQVKNYNETESVEYYNHLIYTRMGSDDLTDSLGEVIHFNSNDSLRLLSGVRFSTTDHQKTNAYVGAALDYEFKGKSSAIVDSHYTFSDSLQGLSGFLELGFTSKQGKSIGIDGSIHCYFGKKEGIGASLMVSKKF